MMLRLMFDDMYPAMPWDEIDAVVFDVGNVLLSFQPGDILHKVLPERPDLYEELTIRVFKSPYWCVRDRGSASSEDVIRAMASNAPELEPYIRRVVTGWIDLPAIPEGIRALQVCKAHGKKLYALTNYADQEFAHACRTHDFFRFFDDFIVSSRLHMVKPERRIYDYLTTQYTLDPARTLFIDDNIANAEGALDAGWQVLCMNRPGKLDTFFAEKNR